MFAVIQTGGKQYKVSEGSLITVEKLEGEAGQSLSLGGVLMISEGGKAKLGVEVAKATVMAEIVAQKKADKVIIFKKKRRHNYRRKNGHRQRQTVLKVTAIQL